MSSSDSYTESPDASASPTLLIAKVLSEQPEHVKTRTKSGTIPVRLTTALLLLH
jgi:hypothetical protein